jgi:hypothetical protein
MKREKRTSALELEARMWSRDRERRGQRTGNSLAICRKGRGGYAHLG